MRISIKDLGKRYETHTALRGVTLNFEPGQIVAVLGLNGAGKTTLLNCLAGVSRCETGCVSFDGEAFDRDRDDQRRRLFYLPDTPPVIPFWNVVHYLGTVLRLYQCSLDGLEDQALEILTELDLLEVAERKFPLLSRGQAYKALLAPFLIVNPELWLLDEPFASGMDPSGFNTLKKHAHTAARQGRTIIYSTQILEVAERFADRICILHRGEVQFYGALAELPGAGGLESLATLLNHLRETPAQ